MFLLLFFSRIMDKPGSWDSKEIISRIHSWRPISTREFIDKNTRNTLQNKNHCTDNIQISTSGENVKMRKMCNYVSGSAILKNNCMWLFCFFFFVLYLTIIYLIMLWENKKNDGDLICVWFFHTLLSISMSVYSKSLHIGPLFWFEISEYTIQC